MAAVEIVARVRIDGGGCVERLICHPRLPLVAGLDSGRPAVHVLDFGAGEPREVGIVGGDSPAYGDRWRRPDRTPAVAWHPDDPQLVVSADGAVLRWTPAESAEPAAPAGGSPGVAGEGAAGEGAGLEGVPPGAAYRPSLALALATTLGEPSPGFPYPQDWLDRMHAWSRHNIAFGVRPGVLWVGTPTGTLIEIDVDDQRAEEHDVLGGAPVTGLSRTVAGQLVTATRAGEVLLLSVLADSTHSPAADGDAARARAAAFLAAPPSCPPAPTRRPTSS